MTIETACSSSMVAFHQACQSIRTGESTMSLVCGSQLYLEPLTSTIGLSTLNFMSPDSQCHSFDERANGYAKGEGIGVLVLKSLADAVAARDTIRAVIRSTVVNQDGRTPGLTQPSQAAQESLIRSAYRAAGLSLDETRLFETHGPGTVIGDLIEASAIKTIFNASTHVKDPIYIGAVKASIGHLEAAAGVAGIIKAILCLEKGIIPPIAGLKAVSREIQAGSGRVRFPTAPVLWPAVSSRRASVNSFGYGGTNSHVIIDDARSFLSAQRMDGLHCTVPHPSLPGDTTAITGSKYINHNGDERVNGAARPYVFVWSAADAAGIQRMFASYRSHILEASVPRNDVQYLKNLAYTLSEKRSILPWKAYFLARSLKDLEDKLTEMPRHSRSSAAPRLHFVFTGQGAQWATMGLDLAIFPVFRDSLTQADSFFKTLGSTWSVTEEIRKPTRSSRLDDPALAQPICTALQVALIDLLESWNIRPWGVVGHSSGEIAAAFCIGAISKESAWRIAYFRGTLAARLVTPDPLLRGTMMAVQLSETDVQAFIDQLPRGSQSICIGCVNSPANTTVTGHEKLLDDLQKLLSQRGILNRKLRVPVAYHSQQMLAIVDEYLQSIGCLDSPKTSIQESLRPKFFSSVTGHEITVESLSQTEYWVRNLVSQVRFREAISALQARSSHQKDLFLEIGPHAVLQRPIQDSLARKNNVLYESTLRRNMNSFETMLNLAGNLFAFGFPVAMDRVNNDGSSPMRMLTDLPQYPFNHSQSHWVESRLFRNYLQRSQIRHELLGVPSSDWNPLRPRWRNTIRVSDLPWLRDHQINGSIIYPAAAMLVMVIEAVRSIACPGLAISGYRFRDVTISSGLTIPLEAEGAEVQLYIENSKLAQTSNISSIECKEFLLCSYRENEWKEVCSGSIITEYVKQPNNMFNAEEDSQQSDKHLLHQFEQIAAKCDRTNSRERLYQISQQMGYNFGPAFQTLHNVAFHGGGGYTTAHVILDEWMINSRPGSTVQDHVIHPTTLDGVLQTAAALSTEGGTVLGPLQVPTHFTDIWISNDLLSRTSKATMRVASKTQRSTARHTDSFVVATFSDTHKPSLVINGYRTTTLLNRQDTLHDDSNLCYALEWKPDVELLIRTEKESYIFSAGDTKSTVVDTSREVICMYYLAEALQELEKQNFRSPKPHLQKYVTWISRHLRQHGHQGVLELSPWKDMLASGHFNEHVDEFAARGRMEKALVTFCSQLPAIVREEQDPLDLLFNHGLAGDLYSDEVFKTSGRHVATFVDLLSHKDPKMKILEIGAGTGSVTEPVLVALSQPRGSSSRLSRCDSYTFTDISPSFFEKARHKFSMYTDRMEFKTLDIEKDPVLQGFEAGQYDLVIAAMVLHATANIEETLQHTRKLLRPGGCLVLVEVTNKDSTISNGIWGTLPGWWRSIEPDRQHGPLYSALEWESHLVRHGFSELEVSLTDCPNAAHHTLSLLVTRSVDILRAPATSFSPRAAIIADGGSVQRELAANIATSLGRTAVSNCDIMNLISLAATSTQYDLCIFILDVGESTLDAISEVDFAALKNIVKHISRILWVTSGNGVEARQPEKAMASGFGRAVTREQPGLLFTMIDVDDLESTAETIRKIVEFTSADSELADFESDYMQSDGLIMIPRVVEAADSNLAVASHRNTPQLVKKRLGEDMVEALRLEFTLGQPESFRFAYDETVNLPLADDEIEVKVKATGINFKDVMAVLGRVAATDIGYECCGIVLRVGAAVRTVSVGDRVCCMIVGCFKTVVRSKEYLTIGIPQSIPFTEAFPSVFVTAIYAINHLARLRKGESILIHAAAGAVGQTAIQIAQSVGADIFLTVGSVDKKELVMQRYGIPPDRVLYSRDLSFGRKIMEATNDLGVNVILNSLSGESLAESWRIIAPLGRFVEIGQRDIQSHQYLAMHPFSKNVSFHSLDLETVAQNDQNLIRALMVEMRELLSEGTISAPQPVTVYTRAEFESAIRYLQTGQHMGKAVVDWEAEAEVTYVTKPETGYQFDPNASYLIAGGFGGIGKSLASWFARNGVRHLILLSRSGATTESAKKLMEELASLKVQVMAPQCDVSDDDSVKKVLGAIAGTMPPIKGCIQSSMVLRDRLFQNMSFEEWHAVLRPKIRGTWNLHNLLPSNMDFFVLLSSLGGMVGSRGQSQYNATSTFLDAFARYRWHAGQRCTSIDVGVVMGVGYAAEKSDVAKQWSECGLQVLQEEDLYRVVGWACDPARQPSSLPWPTQIITAAGATKRVDMAVTQDAGALSHLKRPIFRHILCNIARGNSVTQETREDVDYGALLRGAETVEDAGGIIAAALAQRLSRALSVPLEDIDTARPAHSYGVDSLVAAELRFWLTGKMKADISVFHILGNDSIEQLGLRTARKSDYLREK
ncbi:hypothetical protein F4803DRAFT_509526 [Xylaria telfairii]|nr:hypothetical protein F4803DRAFT_509526 [Xylaria telfairii]